MTFKAAGYGTTGLRFAKNAKAALGAAHTAMTMQTAAAGSSA
jgi:hypothetical protein